MKLLRTWISPLLAFGFAAVANAAPVQYQITADHIGEITWDGTQVTTPDSSDFLFANGTTVSTTFFYDATTPVTSANNPDPNFGPYSYYTGSATNISGTILGHAFSSSSADTQAHNGDVTSIYGDITITNAGAFAAAESPARTSLQGFSVGDFTLIALTFFTGGPSGFAPDQSLPPALTGGYSQIQLAFTNSLGEERFATFLNGQITSVPLPSSILFFMSGITGLSANAFRKFKK